MANVADIIEGANVNGTLVELIYSKIGTIYAVYRTQVRVAIQYADDESLGSEQRKALSALNAVKGEINGLIDGWRTGNSNEQGKARRYDRRVADALICALQGDMANGSALMAGVKADVLAERTSMARSLYLVVAAASVFVVALFAGILSSPWTAVPEVYKGIWAASGFGALGAFFSIALGIRDRSVQTDLQTLNNLIDAVLRVLIGGISAAVLFCLLKTNLIQLQIANTQLIGQCTTANCPLQGPAAQYFIIVLAFIAGFSERLVGDLLSGVKLSMVSSAGNTGAAAPPAAGAAPAAAANEKNPRGLPGNAGAAAAAPPAGAEQAAAAPQPSDDNADGCVTDHPPDESEQTSDVELPEATGGIETPKQG